MDALKVVEVVGRAGADLTRVLATAKTLSPAFKAELAKLIADAEPIAAELAPLLLATPGYADIGLSIAAIATSRLRRLQARRRLHHIHANTEAGYRRRRKRRQVGD